VNRQARALRKALKTVGEPTSIEIFMVLHLEGTGRACLEVLTRHGIKVGVDRRGEIELSDHPAVTERVRALLHLFTPFVIQAIEKRSLADRLRRGEAEQEARSSP
jgi:hypothetical protein